MNEIQKNAAQAIAHHEAALARFITAAAEIERPEDGAPPDLWDAWDEKLEALRAAFDLDFLFDTRHAAEKALIAWMVGVMKAEQGKAFTPELERATEAAYVYPDLRARLISSALRLEARS